MWFLSCGCNYGSKNKIFGKIYNWKYNFKTLFGQDSNHELKKSIRVNKKKINWFYPGQPDYGSTYIFNQVVFS